MVDPFALTLRRYWRLQGCEAPLSTRLGALGWMVSLRCRAPQHLFQLMAIRRVAVCGAFWTDNNNHAVTVRLVLLRLASPPATRNKMAAVAVSGPG